MNSTCIVYVSNSAEGFFLSYEAMVDLLMINDDFPKIESGCKSYLEDLRIQKMRDWLLKKYVSSTFNICLNKHFS